MLELVRNWIDRWFIDGIHFVSFCNPTELKEKVLYYLNSPEERNIISANGYRRATEFYSNVAWWKTVLYESGISLA
jgi:spore maturation protein CgeB